MQVLIRAIFCKSMAEERQKLPVLDAELSDGV